MSKSHRKVYSWLPYLHRASDVRYSHPLLRTGTSYEGHRNNDWLGGSTVV